MHKPNQLLLLLSTILFLASASTYAQKNRKNIESETVFSPKFKERMVWPYIFAADSLVVYYKHNTKRTLITTYEIAKNNICAQFKLSDIYKEAGINKHNEVEDFVYKGNIVHISKDFSKKDELLTLFYTVISKEGKILSAPKEFFTVNSEKESRVNIDIERTQSNITIKAKVVIERKEEEELIIAKHDYNFKQKSNFKFNNKEILQDKEGKLYPPIYGFSDSLFMINIFEEERKSSSAKPITWAFAYTKSGRKLFSQELNSDKISLFSFKVLRVANEPRLIAYYSDDKSDGVDGSVSYAYDPSKNKLVVKESNPIPASVKADFLSKRGVRKNKGIDRFEFSSIAYTRNGEMYNINEQLISRTENSTTAGGRTVTKIVYFTGDYLLMEKYDSTGKLALTTSIETPQLPRSPFGKGTYKLLTQGNKAAIYVATMSSFIPKDFRKRIKGFNKGLDDAIFLYTIKGTNEKNWKSINVPIEKGYIVDNVTLIEGTNKAFVILTKRRPLFAAFWKNLFGFKFETKIGIMNVEID